jgi:hypothetical protein
MDAERLWDMMQTTVRVAVEAMRQARRNQLTLEKDADFGYNGDVGDVFVR